MTTAVRPQTIEELKAIDEVPIVIANSQGLMGARHPLVRENAC